MSTVSWKPYPRRLTRRCSCRRRRSLRSLSPSQLSASIVGQLVTIEEKHTVLAFALAPLATPLLWWLCFGVTGSQSIPGALGGLALVVASSAPWTYGVTVAVGLPIYLAITKWSQLRLWHPIIIGTALGSIVFPLADRALIGVSAVLFGALLGGVSGTAFWVLWRCPTRRCSGPGRRLRSEPGR